MADPLAPQGGATEAVPEPASDPAPAHAATPDAPTERTTATADEESFATSFNPADLPDDLKAAYKQMQADYTRKTQAIRESREKIAAYDQFAADPAGTIRALASQYGLTLAEAKAAVDNGTEFQPNSWDEVFSAAEKRILEKLQPVLSEVRNVKRSQIEKTLDEQAPEWRQYEDEMAAALQQHPSLANDPSMLVRLAIPQSVVESRAMQAALKKLEAKKSQSQVGGGSSTTRAPDQVLDPSRKLTFSQAVEYARKHASSG